MAARAPGDRPNIVLVNCDDLGYGDVGAYGSTVNHTPYLDQLAAEGVRLTECYAASAVCTPSRAGLLTGCHPLRLSLPKVLFPGEEHGLHPAERTVATQLRAAGYATAIVGKWHLGDQPEFLPTRFGFDRYFGLPFSNDMCRMGTREKYPPLPLLRNEEVIECQPDQTALTERYVAEGRQFVREHRAQPFFLYLAHMHTHLPHYPPRRFLRTSRNGAYGAAVEAVDWSVGVLRYELAQLGLAENTLIIFTSDNGSRVRGEGGSNAPLRGTKATSWDGGQRIPMIACWPGQLPAGAVRAGLASQMDLLPTLCGVAGAPVPEGRALDGQDLWPFLRDGAPSPRAEVLYHHRDALDGLRLGRWKLLARNWGPLAAPQLYDLEADPAETTDVAALHPETVARLTARLDEIRADLGDSATGTVGAGRRPCGRVEGAKPLTEFDPACPYMESMYDLAEAG